MNQAMLKEIWQIDSQTLGIKWTDDSEQHFDVVSLRRQCPCAVCVDEKTGKKILQDKDVLPSVRPKSITSVGRYALNIQFSDGHATGIYTFDKLRAF